MIDAFKRASAGRITAVVPYYAYGRSDKKDQPRVPITARLVADMITVAGADRMLTMDLHQGQIQGFFNIPVDELTAVHLLSRYFLDRTSRTCVVVTDLGFAKRARAFAELLDAPLAIVEKRRHGNLDRAEVINVIGEVRGRRVIIVDDEIDTAGTLIEITRALEKRGRHGDLRLRHARRPVRPGRSTGSRAPACVEVIITDTIPLPADKHIPQIKVLSVAPLIGEAIKRIHRGESVGALFSSEVSFTQEMLLWDEGDGRDRRSPGRRRRTITRARTGGRLTRHRPETHEPAAAPPGRQGRPRGPRPGTEENWHDHAPLPALGRVAEGRPAAGAREPGDEPHLDRPVGRVLGGPRAHHVRVIVAGYWPLLGLPPLGNLAARGGVRGTPCGIPVCTGILGGGTALVFALAPPRMLFPRGHDRVRRLER